MLLAQAKVCPSKIGGFFLKASYYYCSVISPLCDATFASIWLSLVCNSLPVNLGPSWWRIFASGPAHSASLPNSVGVAVCLDSWLLVVQRALIRSWTRLEHTHTPNTHTHYRSLLHILDFVALVVVIVFGSGLFYSHFQSNRPCLAGHFNLDLPAKDHSLGTGNKRGFRGGRYALQHLICTIYKRDNQASWALAACCDWRQL